MTLHQDLVDVFREMPAGAVFSFEGYGQAAFPVAHAIRLGLLQYVGNGCGAHTGFQVLRVRSGECEHYYERTPLETTEHVAEFVADIRRTVDEARKRNARARRRTRGG